MTNAIIIIIIILLILNLIPNMIMIKKFSKEPNSNRFKMIALVDGLLLILLVLVFIIFN
ncbi:hypothetical protein [Staphylococcus massiliensis]|uniref:hypothetical protein n=1 Tax=Staphylococcus massiliensis TaxID=555791 RepID=UPI0002DB07BA|nr:hypothetical protein [Staphylococcus massiliensis]MCG3399437.1 hypothetical protein [Staphylococcus massiliensis]MCG3402463.1 hypothetical protein [Staphylococcus massiliensis]MCG3411573.1 hypothetical protein [Staphylococcus massiliensis]